MDSKRARDIGPRRLAREAALQVLYGLDTPREAAPPEDVDGALKAYWSHFEGSLEGRPYGDALVRGVTAQRDELDAALREANPTWRVERMARVDRNVLRLATWELLFSKDIPAEVAITEAVDLAKQFGTEDSGAFVNGTLDRLARNRGRL